MTAITFDTLSTSRRLREKGLPQEQAEAIADEMRLVTQVDLSHLGTKEEAIAFRSELKQDLQSMDKSLRGEMKVLDNSLRGEMREMELRITVKLGAMIFALGGILIAMKFLH
jgi:hypothetical protein